jgi:hypothetical protein
MIDPESHEYNIRAKLDQEQLQSVIDYLASLGVASQISTEGMQPNLLSVDEQEQYEGSVANKVDFYEFAGDHEIDRSVAGKAWALLTRLYDYTVNPDKWRLYRGSNYDKVHLVFGSVPAVTPDTSHLFRGGLADLHFDSLVDLVKTIDKEVGRRGPRAYKNIVGVNTESTSIDFLRCFVAEKLKQEEPTETN